MIYDLLYKIKECYKNSIFNKIFYESQSDFKNCMNDFNINYSKTNNLIKEFTKDINNIMLRVKYLKVINIQSEINKIYKDNEKDIHYLIKVYKDLKGLVELNSSEDNLKEFKYAEKRLLNLIVSFIIYVKRIFHLNKYTPYKWNGKQININKLTVQSFFNENRLAYNYYF